MDRASNFERVRRALPDLPVVSYDRRGYAGSAGLPVSSSLARHAEDLLVVISGEPAVVVGHSFGGLIALAAAAHRPELTLAVGVYEPPLAWEPWWPPPAESDQPEAAAESFFRRMVGDEAWDTLPERFQADRRAEGAALLGDFAAARRGPDFDLADILSPVSAAHGSAGTELFARAAATIADAVHGATLATIEGAAHGAHMSHPELFADWVRTVAGHRTGGVGQ